MGMIACPHAALHSRYYMLDRAEILSERLFGNTLTTVVLYFSELSGIFI